MQIGDLVIHTNRNKGCIEKKCTGVIVKKSFGKNWIVYVGNNKTILFHEMNMEIVNENR